ncbi:MAG: GDP-mannose 4,6-dehydratase [Planctomycetes bacterium]|nr:GDP-mannose 4,6-dehydratase [Planctomycetota bacterium]
MKHKCLVTGGAGFIGSHIAEKLVNAGHSVRIIDDLSSGNLENIITFRDKVEFIEGTITDYQAVAEAMVDIDAVFHLAAMPFVVQTIQEPVDSTNVNFTGTLNLLETARLQGVKAFVFSSSSAVYGDSEILPVHEDLLPEPMSPYAAAKLASEFYLTLYAQIYNLPTVNLRYMNVFGPRQNPESFYSAVIVKFINRIITDRQIEIYGDGEQSRDFVYVENVVNANLLAFEKLITGEIKTALCNIGSGSRLSINELVKTLENLTGKTAKISYEPERIGEIKHSYADISKALNVLDYKVNINFEEGLSQVLKHIESFNI